VTVKDDDDDDDDDVVVQVTRKSVVKGHRKL
jgi:hypothetical protein